VKNNINPIILSKKLVRSNAIDKSFIRKIPLELKLHRTRLTPLPSRLFLHNYLNWIPHAYSEGKKILRKQQDIKFIFATTPGFYSLIVGYLLKKKFHLPLIVEYNDPWSFNPYESEKKITPNKIINYFLEKRILKSAEAIIVPNIGFKDFLISHFPHIKKKSFNVLVHGLELIDTSNNLQGSDNEIIFTFAGSLYGRRSAAPLLQIISELKKEGLFQDIKFKLNIFGKYNEEQLISMIKRFDLSDYVYLGGFITRDQVFTEIKGSNLAVHIGEDLNYPSLSMKIGDYLSCRKRILYIGREDTYTANFLKENDFGDIIPINDLKLGKRKLSEIITQLKNGKFIAEIEDKKLIDYTWDANVEKFKEIIKKFI